MINLHETLAMKIARLIREGIINGQFKPGDRLIQEELANTLGVSRMPLREALKQLEVEGYISLEPHKGAIVKSFSIEEIEEIYFLRSKLEPIALREKYEYFSNETINELEKLVNEMLSVTEVNVFIELNNTFHSILIAECPSKKLNKIIKSLWIGFPQQTPRIINEKIEESNKEHLLIVNALKSNQIDLACEMLEKHILRAGNDVLNNLKKKKS